MRPQSDPDDRPAPRGRRDRTESRFAGRGRAIFGTLLVVLFFLLISLRGIASFYTDYLWFDSVDLTDSWKRMIFTRVGLTFAGGLIFFLICWGNLLIAERLAPAFRPRTGDDDLIDRYHEAIGGRSWLVRLLVALFMSLVIGVTLGAYWTEWLLFTNRVDFGQKDATFNTDIGFYVFQLPFLTSATGWLFSSLLVILVIVVLAHIVNGGIRFNTELDRVSPQVKAHISVLLAMLALVQASRYWLDRYQLVFSTRGTVDGATYTDVNVSQRAIYLLLMISLFAVGLFIANIWRRGWVLPGMAVGLWVLVAVIAGGIVPAFVQRVRVEPTESSRERPYIENNIAATRDAYGLSDITTSDYTWNEGLNAAKLDENIGTMTNIREWDPGSMQDNLRRKQELRSFYKIADVDVDRYVIDGEMTQVMIAARDLDTGGIENATWEATHLIYTNGRGVVAAEANTKLANGDPNLLAKDLPVEVSNGMPEVTEPRVYFGENKAGYVIVNTDVRDPTVGDSDDPATVTDYRGADGIEIGSGFGGFINKTAFALRFGDIDPLVSGSIRPDSKVLLERDIRSRLESIAPFLAYDHDPYLVVVGGRLQYVVDAYTTTSFYPNSQRADTGGLDRASGLKNRSFNYARNSVKAVIDAYDGTVELYVVDTDDPLIKAYQKAFPKLFSPVSDADPEVADHLRYPEDLFTVQTQMWTTYHVGDPGEFYNGRDNWNVPKDPGATRKEGSKTVTLGPDGQELTSDDRYPSQYQLMQLPGEDEASFVLLRPYVTATTDDAEGGQNQLRSFIVASSDPETYGEITTYVIGSSDRPDGPNLAADAIQADADVGDQIRQLCTDKTVCTFAAPSIVPVGESLLYVQSFLVEGTGQGAPQIKNVIVNYQTEEGSTVKIDTSLRGALAQLFGPNVPVGIEDAGGDGPEPDDPNTGGDPDPDDPAETESLTAQASRKIDEIVAAFADADEAARNGDQVTYATKIAEAAELAEELQELRDRTPAEAVPSSGDDASTTTNPDNAESPATTTTTTAGA